MSMDAIKANRLSQAGRAGGRMKALQFGKGGTPGKVQPPRPAPTEKAPVRAKTLFDLEPNDCRWPVGKGNPWRFCAKPKAKGSYCAEHHRRAYAPPGARRA